jgi:hypothetical protein
MAHAEATLDVVGGMLYVTSIDGAQAVIRAHTAAKNEVAIEVLSQAPNPLPIQSISHSAAGLAVHSGAGGTAPLTTALFRYGTAEASYTATAVLRDPRTGTITKPSSVRTIVLDPSDPGAVLLDAGHFAAPDGAARAWAYVRRSSGEAVLVDFDVAGGAVRRTPLGFTPPLGSDKGSVVGTPDGGAFASFESEGRIRIIGFEDIMVSVLQPVPKGTLSLGSGFVPGSTRLGIIAILIGLLTQPTPAISYQVGDEVVLVVPEGAGFRTVARQTVPAEASGLMETDGIWFAFLLPYLEQDNLFRGLVGHAAEPVLPAGH